MYSNYDYHYVIIKEPVFSTSDCSTCFYLRHVGLSEPRLLNDGALEIIVNPSLKISVVLSVYNIIFCIIYIKDDYYLKNLCSESRLWVLEDNPEFMRSGAGKTQQFSF